MPTFRLPQEKPFDSERLDVLCRELTDLTGLALVVWDGDGRFWMPVGFSSTLTGLVVGSDRLRPVMADQVSQAFETSEPSRLEPAEGIACLAQPVRRRRSTLCVLAAVVVTASEGHDRLADWLAGEAGVSPEEASRRIGGERVVGPGELETVSRVIERLASEHIQRVDAEDEVAAVSSKLAQGYEEITLYQRMVSKIRVSEPSEAFFTATCSELLDFLDVEALAALFRDTQQDGEPRVVTLGGEPLDRAQLLALYRHVERDLADGREAVIANDCAAGDLRNLAPGVRNMILVPLRQGKTLYGVIAAFNKNADEEFYSTDVKLVSSVSGTIAIFLENAHLYENLQQLMLGTIRALVSSIDAKDPYTCGHSERVAQMSRTIAERMGLDREDVERIHLAGLLHDIGKIGVPERILLKTGRLDAEEFDLMKTHAAIGARILAGVRELEPVIPGVLHHHERLDGRGYPKGLDHATLPLDSRVIGLADSIDAMTSNRVYRSALPIDRVEEEIRRCTGTQFDVRCVDAAMEIGVARLLERIPEQGRDTALELTLRRT